MTSGGAAGSGSRPEAAGDCSETEQALERLLQRSRACNETADCQVVTSFCLLTGRVDCTGAFYVNIDLDIERYKELEADLTACSDPSECVSCLKQIAPESCVDGLCSPYPQDAYERCEAARSRGRAFVKDHSACNEAADCKAIHSACLNEGLEQCSGWFSVNEEMDLSLFEDIERELTACHPSLCNECPDLGDPTPTCVDGTCGIQPDL